MLTKEKADKVYDLLVAEGGAHDDDDSRRMFVDYHTSEQEALGSTEWRFSGYLGFGGKFWVTREGQCYVTCYAEDATEYKTSIIDSINAQLEKME